MIEIGMADGIRNVLERLCGELDRVGNADLASGLGGELASLLSPEGLSSAFSVAGSSPTVGDPGIDYSSIQDAFRCVTECEKALRFMAAIIHQHIDTLCQKLQDAPEDIALLRSIPILLHCPVLLRPHESWCRTLLVALAQTLIQLKEKCHFHFQTIERWFGTNQALLKRTVKIFHAGFLALMKSKAYREIGTMDTYFGVLGILNKINEDNGYPVPRRLFSIEGLEKNRNLGLHFFFYTLSRKKDRFPPGTIIPKFFSWISVPFMLNVRTKWKFLTWEARFKQEEQAMIAVFENFVRQNTPWFPQVRLPLVPNTLRFDVDRGKIIQSAIENVDKYWKSSDEPNPVWLKALEINFKGEYAPDYGGPSKDFFQELFTALMDPSLSLFFKPFDEKSVSSDVWFNPTNRDFSTLEKIGLLFGLLIFNGAIVTVPFPIQLYEKLLGNRDPTHNDLEEMDPQFVEGLQDLRELTADDLEAMCLDFEGLHPGGEEVCVDKENVEEYIKAMMTHRLALRHLGFFAQGFNRVAWMTPLLREIFKAEDLRDVILGEELDWEAFRKSAHYEPPYRADHPVIKMFWKVFRGLDEKDKRKFLRFLTGADHVPLGGFVPLLVRRLDHMNDRYRDSSDPTKNPDPNWFMPEVYTCIGSLSMDLPEYTNEEDLQKKLLHAIEVKGFHREDPLAKIRALEEGSDLSLARYQSEDDFDQRGGELTIPYQGLTLSIPPGALTEGVCVSVKILSDSPPEFMMRNNEMVVTNTFQCLPSGLHFAPDKSVRLKIPHCANLIHPQKVQAVLYTWHHEENKDTIKEPERIVLTSRTCHVTPHYVEVFVEHFSRGLLAFIINWWYMSGKRMSFMPFLPREMPQSRNVMLELRMAIKPHWTSWRDIHDFGKNGDHKPAKDDDDEMNVKDEDLTVSCQLNDNRPREKKVRSNILQKMKHTVYFRLNFDGQTDDLPVMLTLKQTANEMEIGFVTKFTEHRAVGEGEGMALASALTHDGVADQKLDKLSKHIPTGKYNEFCSMIGFGFNQANSILASNNNVNIRAVRECLGGWKDRTGGSLRELKRVLEEAELQALIKYIEE